MNSWNSGRCTAVPYSPVMPADKKQAEMAKEFNKTWKKITQANRLGLMKIARPPAASNSRPHQKGERAAPSEELKNWMKERMMMGKASTICRTPRKLSSDKHHL